MQGAFPPDRPVRSIPTSKNSAGFSVFASVLLPSAWVDQGVLIATAFDLAQKLAPMEVVEQSRPPAVVTFASPLGVTLLMPTHLNALSVVTVPPVENSPTKRRSPIW